MRKETKFINDEIDLTSLISVIFDNFNFLISIFLASVLIISVYYFSATQLYQSSALLEIQKNDNTSFLPQGLRDGISSGLSNESSLQAEVEIYKSNNTIIDTLSNIEQSDYIKYIDILPSASDVKANLILEPKSKTLLSIRYVSEDPDLSSFLLNSLNQEFIKDRRDFIKQSSAAGKDFIQQEIPRIKVLLKEAEDNLNAFKISTNTPDVIFDSNSRNLKLERLRNRINEIAFKELELKEFYKENHPIYLTLSEQKKLVLSQISEIEADLPNIPSTQRTLENFRREVDIYSGVLSELSSQELSLGMAEASSLSNVRIINEASFGVKISPTRLVYSLSFIFTLVAYIIFLVLHFIGNKITNLDALIDFVGKEKIIGELPNIDMKDDNTLTSNMADELLNKSIYELTHSEINGNSICIVSSRKDVGKSEVSKRLFNKLKIKHKVCLLDLDYRKQGLTKELIGKSDFKSFEEFNLKKDDFLDESGNLFVPSMTVDSPPDFFVSSEFKDQLKLLKQEFDYILCDTPPWNLFVDAKIISKEFDNFIYVVCNKESTFQDINSFYSDFEDISSIRFFYNKFSIYFKFLWYKYQYPYYSNNYYYDYASYSNQKKNLSFSRFLVELSTNLHKMILKWVKNLKNMFKNQ